MLKNKSIILIFSLIGGGCFNIAFSEEIKEVDIGESIINAEIGQSAELQKFQSGESLNRRMLDSNPSGNGDIGSILRILPNVQFDNAQNRSTTPGEIDPANISISGGLHFQNNFQLDGFNMNNDINPAGNPIFGSSNHQQWGSSASQGLSVDTSLLESIIVQDSNVSAAYGRFTGGVVEANVRKPRSDSWHYGISYQHTSSKWTRYHIDPSQYEDFIASSSEYFQPNFTKHLVRANLEGYITQNLGIIASFSTTRSYIPLLAYSSTLSAGVESGSSKNQERVIDNYYIKANYHATDNLSIEANLAYMPQTNTFFRPSVKDSFFDLKSGGLQSGLKAIWQNRLGVLTSSLGYNFMQSSRRSDANYWATWKYSAGDKNWAYNPLRNTLNQGGFGNMDQLSHTLNLKSDMLFEPLHFLNTTHTFRAGIEGGYALAVRNRLNGYYIFNRFLSGTTSYNNDLQGQSCGVDSLGLQSCSQATTYDGWQGQYFNQVRAHAPGKNAFSTLSYGIYAEDDIAFDLKGAGELNVRFGLRLDGDDYMSKHTLAPRFSLNYLAPWSKEGFASQATFGMNRYYGRNLLSYRMYDSDNATQTLKYYTRPNAQSPWQEVQGSDPISDTIFSSLNIPYDDEIMLGLSQSLEKFSVSLKYIYRDGKDQIMRVRKDSSTPTPAGHSSQSWIYNNDGTSKTHIITLSIQNLKPIETWDISHFYLFAFDYTNVKRGYNPLMLSTDYNGDYIDDKEVLYDGNLIRFRDRPVENFVRPWTIRLSTTHTFSLARTKWVWNNFFRYRDGYERMVLLNPPRVNANGVVIRPASEGWNPNYATKDQYAKARFKGAFTWDMRVGFEVDAWRGNSLYVNLDIYNVLNTKNMSTLGAGSAALDSGIADAAYGSAIIYETGRQFWLQVGYRY